MGDTEQPAPDRRIVPRSVGGSRRRRPRRPATGDLATLLNRDPVMPIITRINLIARNFSTPLYDMVLAEHGLSRPEYVIVYNVRRLPGITAQQIAVRTGFRKNTVSAAVHRLIGLGMLRRVRSDDDDRSFRLHLQPMGEAVYAAVNPRFMADEAMALAALTPEERTTLERLLGVMLDTLIRARHAEALDQRQDDAGRST